MAVQRHIAGEYLPDQADHLTEGLLVADGVYWSPTGYRPIPSAQAIPNGTLAAACLGAACYRVNGVVHLLAGTTTNLYRYLAAGWSSLLGSLNATADIGWRFAPAAGYMLATNGVDAIQRYDPSAGTIASLGGSPPTARYITVVRDRVVLGYTASTERKINWSDAGDIADWTAAVGGPGSYEFADGGEITGLGGGEFGLVFQEDGITRLNPAYDGNTWQYDKLPGKVGCVAPWSLCETDRGWAFLSARGWMLTTGAGAPIPIGSEKIDRTFKDLASRSYYPQMSAAYDPENGLLIVAVPNANPSTKVFIYHLDAGKWTTASLTTERLFSGLSQSVTLEQLDTTYPSLDDMETSLDDRIFQGGYPEIMLFNGSHALSALTGDAMAATLTDVEREPVVGKRSRVSRVRPLIDATSGVTATVGGRNNYGGTQTSTSYTTLDRGNAMPVRENWTHVQVTLAVAAGTTWDRIQGYELTFEPGARP